MESEYYKILHNWEHGYKKKLCLFYRKRNLKIFGYKGHKSVYTCAFCGSTNTISIHHYDCHRGIRAVYINSNTGKVDFKDKSKYIPLCRSCHGKIETLGEEIYSKGAPPLLQFLWRYMEEVHGKNGYWHKQEKDEVFPKMNSHKEVKANLSLLLYGKDD